MKQISSTVRLLRRRDKALRETTELKLSVEIRSGVPNLNGSQRFFAVALLNADVHIILSGVVGLRSISEGVCGGRHTTRAN